MLLLSGAHIPSKDTGDEGEALVLDCAMLLMGFLGWWEEEGHVGSLIGQCGIFTSGVQQ